MKKIVTILLILILCGSCGKPKNVETEIGNEVDCNLESLDLSKYFKSDSKNSLICYDIKKKKKSIGIFYNNVYAITTENNDLFIDNRKADASDTMKKTIQYNNLDIEVTLYLCEDVEIDLDKNIEKDISGITSIYYFKYNGYYISGTTSFINLDKRYDNLKDIPDDKLNLVYEEILGDLKRYTYF